MTGITERRHPRLCDLLKKQEMISVLVSGGTDSEVLLRASTDVLGPKRVTALTAVTPLLAKKHLLCARRVSDELGVKLEEIPLNPISDQRIRANGPDRCYHCKKLVYTSALLTASGLELGRIADGTNKDDLSKDRPGLKAAEEEGILRPFAETGMTKKDVRELGRSLGMKDHDRPEDSCLATRLPLGSELNEKTIILIEKIEQSAGAMAQGRIRAMVEGDIVNLHLEEVDKGAMAACSKAIEEFLETKGFSLRISLPGEENAGA